MKCHQDPIPAAGGRSFAIMLFGSVRSGQGVAELGVGHD